MVSLYSELREDNRKDIESLLVEYHEIFTRHRLDIGNNHDFKINLTPKNDRPAYTQSLPCLVDLKDDLTVERALMHYYAITITLPFNKYASPNFASTVFNQQAAGIWIWQRRSINSKRILLASGSEEPLRLIYVQ